MSLCIKLELNAQVQRFIVKKADFNSRINDEFSPVFYKGGLVFCSNLRDNSLVKFKDDKARLFKIFHVTPKDSISWKYPILFSRELTSDFNDGPVTFNANGNKIYYSRNNSIGQFMRNISDTTNNLGIYSAELINGIWTNIEPFAFNDSLYSYYTPSLSPDGKRLYFSTDMPGGYGGLDIYYCNWQNEGWSQPVNLGSVINTPKNESFPFACRFGRLYFSSNGHEGLGGKDIYYTQQINEKWISPVHLDSPINSAADDFGLVVDSTFEKGYFSTNRQKTDDIFSFCSAPVEFAICDSILQNNYCFIFYDKEYTISDTIPVKYIWDFGDSIKKIGPEVKHCFPGPGKYLVKLNVVDAVTGNAVSNQVEYNLDLEAIKQANINSYDIGLVDSSISFDAGKCSLVNFKTTDYLWNFGEGYKPGEPLMTKVFKKRGEYIIRMGLLGEKDSIGIIPQQCVMKKIRIFNSYQKMDLYKGSDNDMLTAKIDSSNLPDEKLQSMIYLMDDLSEQQISKITSIINSNKGVAINFNKNGIVDVSYPFLNDIIEYLKGNQDIRLEMALHTIENRLNGEALATSELYTQQLASYFKNMQISTNSFNCREFGSSPSIFKPVLAENKTTNGYIEFIFMKNN